MRKDERNSESQRDKVENLFGLQEAVNLGLQKSFSLDLKGQKLEIAIDFHDQSYYGKLEQSEGLWVGAEAKNGTTKVYRVATWVCHQKRTSADTWNQVCGAGRNRQRDR